MDDWLAAVEQSADDVNAVEAGGGGADTALNPFLATVPARNVPRPTPSPSQTKVPAESGPAATRNKPGPAAGEPVASPPPKENVAPPKRRRSRQLPTFPGAKPQPGGRGRLRRSASLSFLPTSDEGGEAEGGKPAGGRRRRVLPDAHQGRLIKEMHEKLSEEAKVRLEVVAELKEEKRKRWAVEDALHREADARQRIQEMADERRRQLTQLRAELDDEHTHRADLEEAAETRARELRRLRLELQRMKEGREAEDRDLAASEAALSEAWQRVHEERRCRLVAESDLESIKRGILCMGGREVLDRIIVSARDFTKGMSPSSSPTTASQHQESPQPGMQEHFF